MTIRSLLTFSIMATFALGKGSASAADSSSFELASSPQTVNARDLANLAAAFDIAFKFFDYHAVEPHCIHFFVDEITASGDQSRHDGSGICGLAGPHRLTIQWQADAGRVNFRFMRYRRDVEQGSSVDGPNLDVPQTGCALYGVEPSELEYGQQVVLVHGSYGPNQGPQMSFKVLAELRPNPDSLIGTER